MLGFFNLLWTKGPSVAPLLHIIQSIPSLPNHVVYRLYLSDPTLLACKHFSSSTCVIIPISGRSFRLTLTPLSAAGGSFFSFLIYITSYVACIWGILTCSHFWKMMRIRWSIQFWSDLPLFGCEHLINYRKNHLHCSGSVILRMWKL